MTERNTTTGRNARDAHLTTAFSVLFILWALERIFAMTFVLNFSDQGPDATLLLLALSANGVFYVTPLARSWPHSRHHLDIAFAILVVAIVAAHILPPGWSLFFALLALGAATPLLATVVALQGRNVIDGIAIGMLLHITARSWNEGLPLAATPIGRILGLILVAAAILVWVRYERKLFPRMPHFDERPRLALVMTLLIFEAALFVHPAGVARWAGTDVLQITIGSAGGIAVGAALNLLPPWPAWLRWIKVLMLTGGVTWVTFGTGQAAFATFVAQVGAMRLVARANGIAPSGTIAHIGARTAVIQLGAVLIVFLHAAGPSWAFLPGHILPLLTHDRSALWLFVLASFTAIVATPGLIADDQEVPV